MLSSTTALVAAMRGLSNELDTVLAVPEPMQDEMQRDYQLALQNALNDLVEEYYRRCAADPSLEPAYDLLHRFSEEMWPPRGWSLP
jgi:hypothetical protein